MPDLRQFQDALDEFIRGWQELIQPHREPGDDDDDTDPAEYEPYMLNGWVLLTNWNDKDADDWLVTVRSPYTSNHTAVGMAYSWLREP